MKAFEQNAWAVVAMAVVLTANAAAQSAGNSPTAAAHKTVIVVSLEDRKLALVEDGKVRKIYPVAVGKPSTPSPMGTFTIERRVMNPTYSHNGRIVAPGPNNPVGSRWMGLSVHGYGIHGTNAPSSIGKAASHGCIRMAKADLEDLYPQVSVGDTVELIGARNQETAQLFGNSVQPAAAIELVKAAPAAHPATDSGSASTVLTQAGSALASGVVAAGAL
jgi:lipoprotein-anchoring transpeptidase ErfK/SrfK